MKKIQFYLACAALMGGASLLTACGSDAEADGAPASHATPLRLTAASQSLEGAVGTAHGWGTRAASDLLTAAFAEGDQMRVWMIGTDTKSAVYRAGAPNAAGISPLTIASGETPLKYPIEDVQVIAVSPAIDADATAFVVKTDQTSDANFKASDLMISGAVTVAQANQIYEQALTFSHKMAKLVVTLQKSSGLGNVTKLTLSGINRKVELKNTGKANMAVFGRGTATDSSDDGGTSKEISFLTAPLSTTVATSYACVFPENIIEADAEFLTIETQDGNITIKLKDDSGDGMLFVAGTVYHLNISLNRPMADKTFEVEPWSATTPQSVSPSGILTIAAIASQSYTGSAVEPALTVTGPAGESLTKGVHYTATFYDNVDRGTAFVIVEGISGSDYEGFQAYAEFTIE